MVKSQYQHNPRATYVETKRAPSVFLATSEPSDMTPERVIETGRQFGQRVSKREARAISAVLIGWRGVTVAR